MDAVRRYLKEETNLLTNIMLIMYLHGSQAPRTTEFLSIECYNGPSTARRLYVQDGSVVYITPVNLLARFIWFIRFNWFVLVRFGSASAADLVGSVSSCWFPMETSS
jgi:hypothetical protein